MASPKNADLKSLQGVLEEIELSVNEYRTNNEKIDDVKLRLFACNCAIKTHTLIFMRERYENLEKLPIVPIESLTRKLERRR
jgi:hypothetical protein